MYQIQQYPINANYEGFVLTLKKSDKILSLNKDDDCVHVLHNTEGAIQNVEVVFKFVRIGESLEKETLGYCLGKHIYDGEQVHVFHIKERAQDVKKEAQKDETDGKEEVGEKKGGEGKTDTPKDTNIN